MAAVVGLGLIDGPASARVLGFRALTALIGGAFVALAALCVVHAVAERLRTVRQ